jgi:predicted ATP-dependent Lon-type protease
MTQNYAKKKKLEEFFGESLRYIENDGNTTYYVQIVNPTESQLLCAGLCRTGKADGISSGVCTA